jgi:hypothetical protein
MRDVINTGRFFETRWSPEAVILSVAKGQRSIYCRLMGNQQYKGVTLIGKPAKIVMLFMLLMGRSGI